MPRHYEGGFARPRCHGRFNRSIQRHRIDMADYTPQMPHAKKPTHQCPLCGVVRRHQPGLLDPLTGCCTAKKPCDARRSELDDETIEFLGLIPREVGADNDDANQPGKPVLHEEAADA